MTEPTRTQVAARTNKRCVSLRTTAISAGLAFVLGAWSTHELTRPAAEAVAHLTDKVSALAPWRDAKLLARFKAIDWSTQQPQGIEDIARGLGVSAALRTQVLQQFQKETNDTARFHFQQLLLAAPTPELAAKAQQWAGDAQSAKNRLDGFALLGQMRPSKASRALFMNALQDEQDAKVLSSVLHGLGRSDVPAPQMVSQVLVRLHELTQHAQPEVRQASIGRLGEWDKALRFFPVDVARLLSDPRPTVRIAAIGATSIASLSTVPIKELLLDMLCSGKEELQVRNAALVSLQRFDLGVVDYTAYQFGVADFETAVAASNMAAH